MSKLDDTRNIINNIDKKMAKLFEERMNAVEDIIKYKKENNLPIVDSLRDFDVMARNLKNITNDNLRKYYEKFIINNINLSKSYQQELLNGLNYNVVVKKNSLSEIEKYFNLDRKVLILTDSGIPSIYYDKVKEKCKDAHLYIAECGESSKSIENYSKIINYMIENEFTRSDCIVTCGGGVVGDLGGFVASTYMRGIEFYNIPTTLLSQVDSSIGGKTTINIENYKNTVGSFYPATCVLIDPTVLITLDKRNLYAGLVESIKMGLTLDNELFELIENSKDLFSDIEEIIIKSLKAKNDVVFKDLNEKNIRKVLNFGHTIGHAIESINKFSLLHGECVGQGMLCMLDGELKQRVENILIKYNLPVKCDISKDELYNFILRDKKRNSDYIDIITVKEVGKFNIEEIRIEDIKRYL